MSSTRQIMVSSAAAATASDAAPPAVGRWSIDSLYERVLVLRCQTGDEAALDELIGRYGPRLSFFLRRMLGGDDEADDLSQDIWLDVWRGLAGLRQPEAFAPWLYRIARSRVYRWLRQRRRLAVATIDAPDMADLPAPLTELSFDEADVMRLHNALDQLPHDQREALTLRFIESMTYEQIAAVTDAKLGTVRSRLHYGRIALRRLLEGNSP